MKTQAQIEAKLKQINAEADKLKPLDCGRAMIAPARQALQWVLGQRDNIYGEQEDK